MKILLWLSLFIVFYAFFGYGILLFVIIKIKRILRGKPVIPTVTHDNQLPTCTLVVAAYNEESFMPEKIQNTLALHYPAGKLNFVFITDGSSDRTPDIIAAYPQITLLHRPERRGKIAAVHRAMNAVNSDVVVFTDANTYLNTDALINICRHYQDANVGAVAGEKRVMVDETADATAGEGFYWKYESKLKTWDSELYTVVGAAGELFSIKTQLYKPVSETAILDDFMISLLVAKDGYRVIYEPNAYAQETSSANVQEELKRKIRIAAGGLQSIIWLKSLLNFFRTPLLSFQYISHRVLRWTVVPFLMLFALALNIAIVIDGGNWLYQLLLAGQVAFYTMALAGWLLEQRKVKVKLLFIPYYFCMMNYAVIRGIFRYFAGTQSAAWEKAQRKQVIVNS
ncbi:glycosyltransferase family 2 protein [Mucilaginibacter robiniae]|uniref:Glycosyltransferase family 2 protein n=1 Tax=Mucilaginibacter robiniae TaxID=2728022 RepID=A0A7L5DTY8_9SPHI|nr:glycosyltransferase family 2 protein [Mucilaginibacter robiniae]QJD94575.1 glycosyltransferase family 2 protein [Mucilaginibacter robiniae]